MRVKVHVQFDFEPEPDEQERGHETGLTDKAYSDLVDSLMELGGEAIVILKSSG